MKAIITGTPLQLEGEPAEIAQLVELLSSGAVMVEHVHRWRIGELTGADTVKGACWCGQERDFNPQLPDGQRGTAALGLKDHRNAPASSSFSTSNEAEKQEHHPITEGVINRNATGNAAGKRPFCEDCGRKHKVGNHYPRT